MMTDHPINIHVLGSGTCFPTKEAPRRAHPLFFISWGVAADEHLLLECSANAAERLEAAGIDPASIRHVAVSHAHPDHFALPQLVQSMHCAGMVRDDFTWEDTETHPRLDLFAPGHIVRNLPVLNGIHFEESPRGLLFPQITAYNATEETKEDGFSSRGFDLPGGAVLKPYRAEHGFGKVDALAYRLEIGDKVIAYSGDTGMCNGVIEAATNADLFICEASSRVGQQKNGEPSGYGHLSPRQAGEVAKRAGVKRLILTHHSGLDLEGDMWQDCRASGFEGEIAVAYDKMRLRLYKDRLFIR